MTRYTFYFYAAYEYAAAYAEMKHPFFLQRNHVTAHTLPGTAFWMLDEHFQQSIKNVYACTPALIAKSVNLTNSIQCGHIFVTYALIHTIKILAHVRHIYTFWYGSEAVYHLPL